MKILVNCWFVCETFVLAVCAHICAYALLANESHCSQVPPSLIPGSSSSLLHAWLCIPPSRDAQNKMDAVSSRSPLILDRCRR